MRVASLYACQRASRPAGLRALAATAVLFWSTIVSGHHSVIGVYDDQRRFIVEIEVTSFDLIDPHPLILVEIIDIGDIQGIEGFAIGQTWTLEMDNARELRALGFVGETFLPGDRLIVAVDPSRHTRYRENTLYLRGVEHPRAGFIYIHNLRELIPLRSAEDTLAKYLHRVR